MGPDGYPQIELNPGPCYSPTRAEKTRMQLCTRVLGTTIALSIVAPFTIQKLDEGAEAIHRFVAAHYPVLVDGIDRIQ